MIILKEKVKYVTMTCSISHFFFFFLRNYFPLKLERTLMIQSLLSKLTIKKTMGHQQMIKKSNAQCLILNAQPLAALAPFSSHRNYTNSKTVKSLNKNQFKFLIFHHLLSKQIEHH